MERLADDGKGWLAKLWIKEKNNLARVKSDRVDKTSTSPVAYDLWWCRTPKNSGNTGTGERGISGQRPTPAYNSENPCCQPTPFYTAYCPFHSLAARAFDVLCRWVDCCKWIAAQERTRRENICREPIRFDAFLYLASVQKKFTDLKGFLRFSTFFFRFPP
jgi:hypothetical protein